MCFLVNFAKFLRTPFLTEHLRWLLLYLPKIDITIVKNFKNLSTACLKPFLIIIFIMLSERDFTRSVGRLGPNHKKADCSHKVSNTGVQQTSKFLRQPIIVK